MSDASNKSQTAPRSGGTMPVNTRENSPCNFGQLGSMVGFAVRCMHQHLSSGLTQVIAQVGLKPHQFTALSLVVDNPGISQRELAHVLGIKPSNMVPLIDELENRGFVRRDVAGGNRRIHALMATDHGHDLRDRAIILVATHEDGLLKFLTAEDRSLLLSLIPKIFEPHEST